MKPLSIKIKKNIFSSSIIVTLVCSLLTLGLVMKMSSDPSGEKLGATFQPSGISVNIRQDLVAGASRSDTTLNIDPIVTLDGRRVVMADIGDIAFGKIDQGTSNEEIFSWTTITDNTTYYTLGGINWGYNFYNAATSTANYKRHKAGATMIITNDWHFINANYPSLDDDETVDGTWTFNEFPLSDAYNPTSDYEFATKYYVDNVATSGAANATESIKGLVEIATQDEMASSTGVGGSGASLCISSIYATSTPLVTGKYAVISESDGKLNQSWFDLTEDYAWSGTQTFSATTSFTGTTNMTLANISVNYPTASSSVASKGYTDNIYPIYAISGTTVQYSDSSEVSSSGQVEKSFDVLIAGLITIAWDAKVNVNDGADAVELTLSAFNTTIPTYTESKNYLTSYGEFSIQVYLTPGRYTLTLTNDNTRDVFLKNLELRFDTASAEGTYIK